MPIIQYVNLLGNTVPVYGICVGVGLLIIGVRMLIGFKEFSMSGEQQNVFLYGFPFMVISGTVVALLLDAWFTGDWRSWSSQEVRRFGFTYTGWLLGALVFMFLYGVRTTYGWRFFLNFYLPSFAAAQAIGRVGCFLGGCCYGKVCSLGVKYPVGSLPYEQVGDVCVLPIQLIESFLLLGLFLLSRKSPFRHRASVYLCGVACIRFFLEFFRGDVRGSLFGVVCISPQQIMSIAFFVIGLIIFVKQIASKASDDACVGRWGRRQRR